MPDEYLALEAAGRGEVLQLAARQSGDQEFLFEKDIWVVWCLQTLFGNQIGRSLVFKGGTSLSKAHLALRRFSEDVDLTYDIREFMPDLVGDRADGLPPNRSQEKRWTKEARGRLTGWVADEAAPFIAEQLARVEPVGTVRAESDCIYVGYRALSQFPDYVSPQVKLEFGARSTGEPHARHDVACDAAPHVPDVAFPSATPNVMIAERTCLEKMLAAHVYCAKLKMRSERFSRHWFDLSCLRESGHVEKAVADRELVRNVAAHNAMFFREKDLDGVPIDFQAAVEGGLRLVPEGRAREDLERDYGTMVEACMIRESAPGFDDLMEICAEIENMANDAARAARS